MCVRVNDTYVVLALDVVEVASTAMHLAICVVRAT